MNHFIDIQMITDDEADIRLFVCDSNQKQETVITRLSHVKMCQTEVPCVCKSGQNKLNSDAHFHVSRLSNWYEDQRR